MSTTFPSFANGDIDYVTKLNSAMTAIASILDGIDSVLAGVISSGASPAAVYTALFGGNVAVVGAGSYASSGSSTTLTVAAGFAWKPTLGTVVRQITSGTISFSGQSAGTYYVEVDGTGAPSRSATNSGEALYSVVWTGAAFGTITRLAAIVFGAEDDIAAQTSTALSATYTSLDARFEAVEALAAPVSDPELAALAGLTSAANKIPYFTGSGTAALLTLDTDGTLAANSDTTIATQKATKTAIAAAVAALVNSAPGSLDTLKELADAINDDASFSATIVTALGAKAPLANPTFTGTPIVPTAAPGTNTTQAASTAFVAAAVTAGTTDVAASIHGVASKGTPVDADELGLVDSAASNVLKKLTWANLKATLKTYFDTLYAPLSQPFDVHAYYPGIPTASAKVVRVPIARAVSFAGNFAGSYFTASANATASTVFDVQKNGASIGSITIALGTTTATFTTTSGTAKTFAAGDVLMIVCPASPDVTLADPGFVLAGTR